MSRGSRAPLGAGETYRVLAMLDVGADFAWRQSRYRLFSKPRSRAEPTTRKVSAPKETEKEKEKA
jgi:hypothetical protein